MQAGGGKIPDAFDICLQHHIGYLLGIAWRCADDADVNIHPLCQELEFFQRKNFDSADLGITQTKVGVEPCKDFHAETLIVVLKQSFTDIAYAHEEGGVEPIDVQKFLDSSDGWLDANAYAGARMQAYRS